MMVYQSNEHGGLFIEKGMADISAAGAAYATISVDVSKSYQVVDGFGASFTDSSAFLINNVLDEGERTRLMERLFCHDKGIGISMLRNPMGSSDYARRLYNYNGLKEGETDFALEHFSIEHDMQDILPLTKRAMEINPHVKLMASPWSAPAWMKTSGSMIGGELREDCYDVYAQYFVRFIQAYAAEGVGIYAVTPQNEPLYLPAHYPGMHMPAHAAAAFIKGHLKPAFVQNGINTKILCYDHNWDRADYPLSVLDEAYDAVDGVAWHWYGGRPVAQSHVLAAYPDKEVHFTEGSGGSWIPAFEPAFSNLMRTAIAIMRNHSRSLVLWNMALDENNGPSVPGFGKSTCRGIVQISQATGALEYTLDYYGLAHFSKHVRPAALRVASTAHDSIHNVCFKNPDGSIVAILFNDEDEARDVKLVVNQNEHTFNIDAKTALTIVL